MGHRGSVSKSEKFRKLISELLSAFKIILTTFEFILRYKPLILSPRVTLSLARKA